MRKKLLIATDNFLPRWDGIARFLSEIIPRLSLDYDITILAPAFEGYKKSKIMARTIRFPVFKFSVSDFPPVIPPFFAIKKYIEEADMVWIQTIGPIGFLAAKNAKKFGKPLVAYTHSIEWELVSESVSGPKLFKGLVKSTIRGIAKRLYNKCDLLIVPSQEVAVIFKKAKITTPKVIVPLGINTNRFKPSSDKTELKKSLGIDSRKKVIGFCGRIGREKDLLTLYRAFVALPSSYNAMLLIVGDGIWSHKRIFDRKNNLLAVGSIDNVIPYLQVMDVFVLPSLTETTSLATMEAMATGCAVLATKVGSVANYVKEKNNGMFFPMKNSYVLRKKLEMLLDNKELREDLGKNARKTIMSIYSWDNIVKELEKVFKSF